MPRGRRPNPPVPQPPAESSEGIYQRLKEDNWADSTQESEPSPTVAAILEHNREHVRNVARYSAMQAMPLILARGERTTLEEETKKLVRTIEGLVQRALDDEFCNAQDNCGAFSVEVWIARQSGEGYTHRAKNLNVLEVDVTIPLETALLAIPQQSYARLAKLYADWLGDGE